MIIQKYLEKKKIFICMFFIILILCVPVTVKVGTDDSVTRSQLETMSVLQWVIWRTETWQPRIVSDFLVASFSLMPMYIWRISIAIVVALLLHMICGITGDLNGGVNDVRDIVICCLFMTVLPPILSSTLFWFTGTFYYPIPTLFMMFALVPVYRTGIGMKAGYNKAMQVAACFATALCSYMEQNAAVICCFTLFTIIYCLLKKRTVPAFIFLELAVVVVNVLIYFKLGGTEIRKSAELFYYKNYHMLTLVDRLFQGINWGNQQLLFGSKIPTLTLTLLLCAKIYIRYESRIIRFISTLPAIFVAFSALPFDANLRLYYGMGQGFVYNAFSLENGIGRLIDPMLSNPGNANISFSLLISSIVCLFIVLMMSVLIYLAYEHDALPRVVLFFAALASSYVLGLSPTIFASGTRIFFLTEILILILISDLFTDLYNGDYSLIISNKKVISLLLIAMSCFYYLEHWFYNLSGLYR